MSGVDCFSIAAPSKLPPKHNPDTGTGVGKKPNESG
jgi:hypothetical protein